MAAKIRTTHRRNVTRVQNTRRLKSFTQIPDDSASFYEKLRQQSLFASSGQFQFDDSLIRRSKAPRRYWNYLERILNTRACRESRSFMFFVPDVVIRGTVESQTGELMTLLSVSLMDSDATQFYESILDFIRTIDNADRIVKNSWIASSVEHRYAILNEITHEFQGQKILVDAVSWDEPVGLAEIGYDVELKTRHADIFIKYRLSTGTYFCRPYSLKQRLSPSAFKLLTTAPTYFYDWDSSLESSLNLTQYGETLKSTLIEYWKSHHERIMSHYAVTPMPRLEHMLDERDIDFRVVNDEIESGTLNREVKKIVYTVLSDMAEIDEESNRIYRYIRDVSIRNSNLLMSALCTYEQIKSGFLEYLKSNFPLTFVSQYNESIIFGKYVCNRRILNNVFDGDDSWMNSLDITNVSTDVPRIYYKSPNGEITNIARVFIYEDGLGYGGKYQLNIKIDKELCTKIRTANRKLLDN